MPALWIATAEVYTSQELEGSVVRRDTHQEAVHDVLRSAGVHMTDFLRNLSSHPWTGSLTTSAKTVEYYDNGNLITPVTLCLTVQRETE